MHMYVAPEISLLSNNNRMVKSLWFSIKGGYGNVSSVSFRFPGSLNGWELTDVEQRGIKL